jgi:hypothetical protein
VKARPRPSAPDLIKKLSPAACGGCVMGLFPLCAPIVHGVPKIYCVKPETPKNAPLMHLPCRTGRTPNHDRLRLGSKPTRRPAGVIAGALAHARDPLSGSACPLTPASTYTSRPKRKRPALLPCLPARALYAPARDYKPPGIKAKSPRRRLPPSEGHNPRPDQKKTLRASLERF